MKLLSCSVTTILLFRFGGMTSFSQPDPSSTRERTDDEESFQHPSDEQLYSFSQPIDPENMLLSQIPCTPGSSQVLSPYNTYLHYSQVDESKPLWLELCAAKSTLHLSTTQWDYFIFIM